MLDLLDYVLRELVADFDGIKAPRVTELLREDYGYAGSVDLVRRRLAELRPTAERPAQETGRLGGDAHRAQDPGPGAAGLRVGLHAPGSRARRRRISRST